MPQLKLTQQQEISPYLLLSIRVLQMNMTELRDYVEKAFCENPLVDVSLPQVGSEQININRILYYDRSARRSLSTEEHAEFLAQLPADEQSLYTHLHDQLALTDIVGPLSSAAEYIIGCLDERGYLTESTDRIAQALALPPALVLRALDRVQALDPPGVAARDLKECLLLQLRREGQSPLAEKLVTDHLEDLGKQRFQSLASLLNASVEELRQAYRLIQTLDPTPGTAFERAEPVYIVPDIQVQTENGVATPVVRNDLMPQVRIHPDYLQMMENSTDENVRRYLRENLARANTLISLVGNRQSTLERCAQQLVKRQEGFFLADEPPVPMTMTELARELELNVSTVSRALRDKYLQCSRGVYPLSFFFSRGLPAFGSEEGLSPEHIRNLLLTMISGEDPRRPLSDQQLSDRLREDGILVARRTVAKYRKELGLPSTAGRRRS